MAAGITDKLWEVDNIVAVIEAWETEQATSGIVYEIGKDRIGDGYHVRTLTRYDEPSTEFGFATIAEAEAYIEARRAEHRPGRRKKLATTDTPTALT
jgi:hypothetical protein